MAVSLLSFNTEIKNKFDTEITIIIVFKVKN